MINLTQEQMQKCVAILFQKNELAKEQFANIVMEMRLVELEQEVASLKNGASEEQAETIVAGE
jgi:hypothetical protein